MNILLFSFPEAVALTNKLQAHLNAEFGLFQVRDFPDGETYVRIDSDVTYKTVFIVCYLDHPNTKALTLMFMARTLKALGAKNVILVAPYLPYMRQDKQFHPGEAITSIQFAEWLSSIVDGLITIDPHLHRIKQLTDIYPISVITLHAIKPISEWIKQHVSNPLIVGPDEESFQWVKMIADELGAPCVVSKKTRHGDRDITIEFPVINDKHLTPVIVDDIISTGTSMAKIAEQLLMQTLSPPICIGIHALFSHDAYDHLLNAGVKEIVTCNTIPHVTNQIDISAILVDGMSQLVNVN